VPARCPHLCTCVRACVCVCETLRLSLALEPVFVYLALKSFQAVQIVHIVWKLLCLNFASTLHQIFTFLFVWILSVFPMCFRDSNERTLHTQKS